MKAIIKYLKEKYSPLSIIVYGSYADGSNSKNSDFDALVITSGGERVHDTSVVARVKLDAFIYPLAEVQKADNYEEFIQIFDGQVIFDTDGIGEKLRRGAFDYLDSKIKHSKNEVAEELEWCEKMLVRAKREDPEGDFRLHMLLVDSLEIACDVFAHSYLGPKKTLMWLEREHPKLYAKYTRALKDGNLRTVKAWITALSEAFGER